MSFIEVKDIKLGTCPFCEGEVELWKYREIVKCRFICKKCKCEVEFPRGLDTKDCIRKWNGRGLGSKGITEVIGVSEIKDKVLSETICMDEGPNQFKQVYYKSTCPHGYTDCVMDPAYIKATYPSWYNKLYGDIKPEEVVCENCANGERYDDEDK